MKCMWYIQYDIYCVLVSILFVESGVSLYWKSMFRLMMDEWVDGSVVIV